MDLNRDIRLTADQSLHLVVMRAVAEHIQDTPYVLKGGAALILTRRLERYSTDLDFDAERKINLIGRIETALREISDIEIRTLKLVKDTDTVQRYKVHYLNRATGQDTLLKVETSFRDHPTQEAIETVAGIKTYRIEYLFDQKLRAAQNRTEGRDLYDLAFLIEQFGNQLRDDQVQAVQQLAADPDQLLEQYQPLFQSDAALASLTSIEDTVLSLHLGAERLLNERAIRLITEQVEEISKSPAELWEQYSRSFSADTPVRTIKNVATAALQAGVSDYKQLADILHQSPLVQQLLSQQGTDAVNMFVQQMIRLVTQPAREIAIAAAKLLKLFPEQPDGSREFDQGSHWYIKQWEQNLTITNKPDGRIILQVTKNQPTLYNPKIEDENRLALLKQNFGELQQKQQQGPRLRH
jgi:predicted nucleotidyltransferase component of viral defense system